MHYLMGSYPGKEKAFKVRVRYMNDRETFRLSAEALDKFIEFLGEQIEPFICIMTDDKRTFLNKKNIASVDVFNVE